MMMSNFAALFPVNSFVAPPVKTTCTCQNARLVKNTREAIPGEKRQKTRAHKNASAPKYIKMRQKTPGEKTPNLFAHYFSTAVTLHVPGLGYEK